MATIVLSAVGGLIGGPVGSAIGAILGQQVDNRLFAPRARRGPRLNELAVQSSSYGQAIPKLFGTNRVAGTVIWSTDLKESRRRVSNGKGQPKSTVYSYSASFAVALSARPIHSVGRIWADGNLLRGGDGVFKSETRFRLHQGREDQPLDPLIASAEGMDRTPAYRGLAYVVFEDLALGDFGNRVPSLSFEVVADQGDIALGEVFKAIAAEGIEADCSQSVHGIAVTGDSVRGLVETLQPLFPVHVSDDGAGLSIHEDLPNGGPIRSADLGASRDEKSCPPLLRLRGPAVKETNVLSVAHYEPERDYQQGLQRVRRAGDGNREERIDMPVAISAGALRMFAGAALSRRREERRRARVRLPWNALNLRPASLVTLPDDETIWRVVSVSVDRMVVEADLVAHSSGPRLAAIADAGSGMLQPDRPQGPTTVQLIDLPPLGHDAATAPRIAVAAAGLEPGWKAAGLLVSTDGGASWKEAGNTAAPAIMGHAMTALPPGSCRIEDRISTVEIALLNRDMALQDAGPDALLAGANAAMLGREIIQFARAVQTGPASFSLSGLLRGRRGTEWAVGEHVSGESFVLLESDALALIEVPVGASEVRLLAKGAGDNIPVEAVLPISSEAVRPLTPVQLRLAHGEEGSLDVRWVRRSRSGWDWLDGVDAPLSEENEVYHVSMVPDVGPAFTETVGTASLEIPASRLAALRAAGATRLALSVRQLGKLAQSRETMIDIMPETQGH